MEWSVDGGESGLWRVETGESRVLVSGKWSVESEARRIEVECREGNVDGVEGVNRTESGEQGVEMCSAYRVVCDAFICANSVVPCLH